MIRIVIFIVASVIIGFTSCKSSRPSAGEKPVMPVRWMSYMKSPCFGHCPVYRIQLYRNGLCILEGKEYLDKKGVYFAMLSKESFKNITDFSKLNWASYDGNYFMNLPDLPSSEFIMHDENGAIIKKIKSNTNLPKEIGRLHAGIGELIRTEKWTQIQRREDMTNPEIIYSEIQLDMDSSITVEQLQLEYPQFKIEKKDRISEYMNFWLIGYDQNQVNPYEILVILRQKKGVRNAFFNRKLLPRE
jgi:Domain of unknown function (DUF6438)